MQITVPGIRSQAGAFSAAETDAFLISARAALKKRGPPVEAPINPINAPRRPQNVAKIGRPSVNMPTENVAAFLTELKSAKLKKTDSSMAPPLSADRERPEFSSMAASSKGRELLRTIARRKSLSELDVHVGAKRKRDATEPDESSGRGELITFEH